MTWGELKRLMAEAGVDDDDEIRYIDGGASSDAADVQVETRRDGSRSVIVD